jgi:hypothetical protein
MQNAEPVLEAQASCAVVHGVRSKSVMSHSPNTIASGAPAQFKIRHGRETLIGWSNMIAEAPELSVLRLK